MALGLSVAIGWLPPQTLLAIVSLPFLAQVIRSAELGATGQQRAIAMIDVQTARLHLTFGSLLVLGPALSASSVADRPTCRGGPAGRTRPGVLPLAVGLAAAAAAFTATFNGPRTRFWQRMTLTGLGLGGWALLTLRPLAAARDLAGGTCRRALPRPACCT